MSNGYVLKELAGVRITDRRPVYGEGWALRDDQYAVVLPSGMTHTFSTVAECEDSQYWPGESPSQCRLNLEAAKRDEAKAAYQQSPAFLRARVEQLEEESTLLHERLEYATRTADRLAYDLWEVRARLSEYENPPEPF